MGIESYSAVLSDFEKFHQHQRDAIPLWILSHSTRPAILHLALSATLQLEVLTIKRSPSPSVQLDH
jgi:hypothetical protein